VDFGGALEGERSKKEVALSKSLKEKKGLGFF